MGSAGAPEFRLIAINHKHLAIGALFPEFAPDSSDSPSGAGANNGHVYFSIALVQDFFCSLVIVSQGVAAISILKVYILLKKNSYQERRCIVLLTWSKITEFSISLFNL